MMMRASAQLPDHGGSSGEGARSGGRGHEVALGG
jgi:hypothetical protein